MNTTKMGLSAIKSRLTREELKSIVAGDLDDGGGACYGSCQYINHPADHTWMTGECVTNTNPMQTGCACKKSDGSLVPGGCIQ